MTVYFYALQQNDTNGSSRTRCHIQVVSKQACSGSSLLLRSLHTRCHIHSVALKTHCVPKNASSIDPTAGPVMYFALHFIRHTSYFIRWCTLYSSIEPAAGPTLHVALYFILYTFYSSIDPTAGPTMYATPRLRPTCISVTYKIRQLLTSVMYATPTLRPTCIAFA